MLLKSKDDLAPQLAKLDELGKLQLTARQRASIARERAIMQAGLRGEKEAAFQIDFRLKDHKDWAVIHDLRLEHNGRVAQIDHLIFHPNWEFYVVETKGIRTKLRVENGQWSFLQNNDWRGMPSPVEQNARHIQVLKELLRDSDLLPRTFGVPVIPRFINVVLVSPDCLIRLQDELTWVLKMDEFVTKVRWDLSIGNAVLNLIHNHSGADALRLGQKLVAAHRPFTIDYHERFGISPTPVEEPKNNECPPGKHCETCEEPISDAEAFFCRMQKSRFAGQLLCRRCQSYVPAEAKPATVNQSIATGICASCGATVDAKVIAFCRFNSRRFKKQVLCRNCQSRQ